GPAPRPTGRGIDPIAEWAGRGRIGPAAAAAVRRARLSAARLAARPRSRPGFRSRTARGCDDAAAGSVHLALSEHAGRAPWPLGDGPAESEHARRREALRGRPRPG